MAGEGEQESTVPLLSVEGNRATVRLNRPRYRNRIEPEDLLALRTIFDRVEADPKLRVLVLTGTGKAFSSGYHLGDLAARLDVPGAAAPEGDDGSAFEALTDRLEALAVPTVCRLNGGVYGGATDLALACDFRIGQEGCQMVMPAGRLGIHYYTGGIVRYVTRLGPAAAKKLFLTGGTIDAAEMLRIGYLDEVVPEPELDRRVDALAATLAAAAPVAIRGMKRTINEIARGTLDVAAADRRHRDSRRGPEIREGMQAFAERRPPVFD